MNKKQARIEGYASAAMSEFTEKNQKAQRSFIKSGLESCNMIGKTNEITIYI